MNVGAEAGECAAGCSIGVRACPARIQSGLRVESRIIRSFNRFLPCADFVNGQCLFFRSGMIRHAAGRSVHRRRRIQKRSAIHRELSSGNTGPLRKYYFRDCYRLLGLNQLRPGHGGFRIGTRKIRARAKFGSHERAHYGLNRPRPLARCLRHSGYLFGGKQREEGVRRGRASFKPVSRDGRLRAVACGLGVFHIGFTQSEIEWLPRNQPANCAAPYVGQAVGSEHGSGNGRQRRLRQKQAHHVVARRAVDLRQEIGARQVRRPRQLNSRGCGPGLLDGHADRRVVLERLLHGL